MIQAVMKFCYHCRTWFNVYADQSICPRCNHEGLRE